MPNLGPWEIVIIALVVLLLFGWKKLPDMARSLGRSARVFKSEVNEMKHDAKPGASDASRTTVEGDVVNPVQTPAQDPVQTPDPTRDQTTTRPDGPVA